MKKQKNKKYKYKQNMKKKEKKTNPDPELLLGRPGINKEPTQTYYWAGPESIKAN
jgi:hypothetical protein